MIFYFTLKIIHKVSRKQTFNNEVVSTTYYYSDTMGQSHDKFKKFRLSAT